MIEIVEMDQRLRPAAVGFMAALQEHERRLSPDRVPGHAMADGHLAYLEDQCRAADGLVLMALLGGTPCGFAVGFTEAYDDGDLHIEPSLKRYGEITDLYVEPVYRHRGVARALLAAMEAHFRRRGLASVRLSVLHDNLGARGLYQSAGYRAADVVYVKSLAEE